MTDLKEVQSSNHISFSHPCPGPDPDPLICQTSGNPTINAVQCSVLVVVQCAVQCLVVRAVRCAVQCAVRCAVQCAV